MEPLKDAEQRWEWVKESDWRSLCLLRENGEGKERYVGYAEGESPHSNFSVFTS